MTEKEISFAVEGTAVRVSGLLVKPAKAHCFLVFGHGAGAGMRHPFMASMARLLAERGIATFRYQFPYMEEGGKRPDSKPVLLSTVRAAVSQAGGLAKQLPLFVGGKSMGGRMSSMAMAEEPLAPVEGIVFFGFPLHPPGQPSDDRAAHLTTVTVPMLFLQGTRDKLADLRLLRPVVRNLGELATLHIVEGGDHSFHVPRPTGLSDDDVLNHLADAVNQWTTALRANRSSRLK